MISKTMAEAMNEQINAELYSSYLYLAMAAWAQDQNLPGVAHWLLMQTEEERLHGMKIFYFLLERGDRPVLKPITTGNFSWKSTKEVFEEILKHERHVTSLINKLVDLAIKESDHATNNFLQWYVAEQVEEEASAEAVLRQLQLMEGAPGGMFLLDRELATRAFATELVPMLPGGASFGKSA